MNNTNLQRAINYDPYLYQIDEKMDIIHQNMSVNNAIITSGFKHVEDKIDVLCRKPRKCRTDRNMAILQNGDICMVDFFNDGSQEMKRFISNASGPLNVYRVQVEEQDEEEFFAIQVSNPERWIIGRVAKLKESYLFRKFCQAGIHFCSEISIADCGRTLYQYFANEVIYTESTISISCMSGWWRKRYWSRENFAFAREVEFAGFPVMKKVFPRKNLESSDIDFYINGIKKFRRQTDRLIMLIYPFWALMASVFEQNGYRLNCTLNIIPSMQVEVVRLRDFFGCDKVWRGNVNGNQLYEILNGRKDEVLLIDFRSERDATDYEKRKVKNNLKTALSVFKGYRGNSGTNTQCGLVTISDVFCMERGTVNILLDTEMYDELCKISVSKDNNRMHAIFAAFIEYVEENYDSVVALIRQDSIKNREKTSPCDVIVDILHGFWSSKGIVIEAADISKNIRESELFEGEEELELIDVFREAIRKGCRQYIFAEKQQGNYCDEWVRFDKKYIWFPPKVFDAMLSNYGLRPYASRLLLQLRDAGALMTDSDGLRRKLQIAGERHEFYQFERSFFNALGRVDIIELGQEVIE